jgi:hypothetical protein
MTAQILVASKLQCLMVDMQDDEWVHWLEGITNQRLRPSTIIWMTPSDSIGDMEEGPIHSGHQKRMTRLGYEAQYWHLKAELYGAALRQSRLAVIYTKQGATSRPGPIKPAPMRLPPRPMSNLLLPMIVPRGAWNKNPTQPMPPQHGLRYLPCVVTDQVELMSIYSAIGPMPDRLNVWVGAEAGIRHLQACELAKAKGLPNGWKANDELSNRGASWIQRATCSHLWAAVLDPIAQWLLEPVTTTSKPRPRRTRRAKAQAETPRVPVSGLQPDWSWQVPDLSPGGAWHQERVSSLEVVIAGNPKADQLRAQGLEILARHQKNYTPAGPQALQLIW